MTGEFKCFFCAVGSLTATVLVVLCLPSAVKGICAAHGCLVRTCFDSTHSGRIDELDRMLAAVLGFHDHSLGSRIQLGDRPVDSGDGVLCGPDQSTQKRSAQDTRITFWFFISSLPKNFDRNLFSKPMPQYGISGCSKRRPSTAIADQNMAT